MGQPWKIKCDAVEGKSQLSLVVFYRGVSELNRAAPHGAVALLASIRADLAVVTWADLLKLQAGVKLERTGNGCRTGFAEASDASVSSRQRRSGLASM